MEIQLEDVIDNLYQAQNQTNRAPMEAYQRNQFSFLGIKAGSRRKLTQDLIQQEKRLSKEKAKAGNHQVIKWTWIYQLWDLPEREFQYFACDYLQAMEKYLTIHDLDKLEYLITHKSWWDSVDALVKRIGTLQLKNMIVKSQMLAWAQDQNFWKRRAAILHQLALKESTDKDLLAKIIKENFGQKEFFVNKAIGWSLREYAKVNPQWVLDYVKTNNNNLAALSIKEATKYLNY